MKQSAVNTYHVLSHFIISFSYLFVSLRGPSIVRFNSLLMSFSHFIISFSCLFKKTKRHPKRHNTKHLLSLHIMSFPNFFFFSLFLSFRKDTPKDIIQCKKTLYIDHRLFYGSDYICTKSFHILLDLFRVISCLFVSEVQYSVLILVVKKVWIPL